MAAITICSDFGAQKIKSATVSIVSPSICHEVMGPNAMILVFKMLSFKPTFSLSSYNFIKRLFSSSSLSAIKGFGIVNKAEIDVFLELSCFFNDPVDVGNLISGSSAFPKTSLSIWKFTVHVLLKPGLENFACSIGDPNLGLGRSAVEENGYSLQCSCLENSMDRRGAWWATVHWVAKSLLTLSLLFISFI